MNKRMGILGLVALVAACSDSQVVAPGARPATALSSPQRFSVVSRDTPLAAPQTASAVIGIFGGTISLPGAGLTVVVPAFALASPTTITVTAVAGSQVAYEFEPHGTQFLAPVIVTQVLAGTSASGPAFPSLLRAGYFADLSALDPLRGTALVSELLGTTIDAGLGTATFAVTHFSGYLLATGKADPPEEGGSQ